MSNLSEEEKYVKERKFLEEKIFTDLPNWYDGFDNFFSSFAFETILERVKKLGIGIYGIEVWLDGQFYDVAVHEAFNLACDDAEWYQKAFSHFKQEDKNFQYTATYAIPDELLSIY